MQALRIALVINGLVFVLRATLNIIRPTSFYLEPGAPEFAIDAIRVLGVTYGVLGTIQIAQWWSTERTAVRVVAWGSFLFAVGVSIVALTMDPSSTAPFHEMRMGSAVENLAVGGLYGFLLLREFRMPQKKGHGLAGASR